MLNTEYQIYSLNRIVSNKKIKYMKFMKNFRIRIANSAIWTLPFK